MHKRLSDLAIPMTCSLCALVWAPALSAQGNPEAGDMAPPPGQYGGQVQGGGQVPGGWQPAPIPGQAPVDPSGQVAYAPDAVPPPPEEEQDDTVPPGSSDHAAMVGRFGVGFFGVASLPTVVCGNASTIDPTCAMIDPSATLSAPTIGARYWISEGLGIEAALGLNVSSGDNGGLSSSAFGFALHGGVPLALAHTGSFVFEVVPQLNFGITSGSFESMAPAIKTDVSGVLFEIGAEVGAEIHFGFIGLPQLSLQGTIGLMLRNVSRTVTIPVPGTMTSVESEKSDLTVATTVDNAPWQLFTQSITAIYYF